MFSGGLSGFALLVFVVPCCCCGLCCYKIREAMFTRCKFCEKKIKKEEHKEHRQNCFTEKLAIIQGYKEAPLPKECPEDGTHPLPVAGEGK